MKKVFVSALLTIPFIGFGQSMGIGLKGGLNFANVTSAASINSSSRSGFMFGIFMAPPSKGLISSRTELVYSRQGYDFKTGTGTGNVDLDYIVLPQLMGINITKFVQLQLGVQMAFLINAKADSTNNSGGMSGPYSQVMSYYSKFDYGYAIGGEIHPFKGLLIGARYNVSIDKLYRDIQTLQQPSFSSVNAKNNIVQIFAGYTFGKQPSKKK